MPVRQGFRGQAQAAGKPTLRIVRHTTSMLQHSLGIQTPSAAVEGHDDNKLYANFTFRLENIDVWALYSPQGHAAMELAFMSYVSRANRLGIFPGGQPMNPRAQDGKTILQDTREFAILHGSPRTRLIGSLIIHSVYDGILIGCGSGTAQQRGKQLGAFSWDARKVQKDQQDDAEKAHYELPALGLSKEHKGLWRKL